MTFRTDAVRGAVQEVHLLSASGLLDPGKLSGPASASSRLDVTNANEIDLFRQGLAGGELDQFPDGYDLGDILPICLSPSSLLQDLKVSYTTNGSGIANEPAALNLPEPASLAWVAAAAVGLLRRRRRERT